MMASRNKHNFDTVSQSSFDWICLRARQRGRGVPAGAGCGRPREERPGRHRPHHGGNAGHIPTFLLLDRNRFVQCVYWLLLLAIV